MKIEIAYTDGTSETVERVDGYEVRDGQLHAWHQSVYREDLGFWPLGNIRRWKTIKDGWE